MQDPLALTDLQNYQRCKESFFLSELLAQCNNLHIILSIQRDELKLLPEHLMNLSGTGYASSLAYAIIPKLKYLGKLVAELSWRDGSIKDSNKDLHWEAIAMLGETIEQLWKKEKSNWPDADSPDRTQKMSTSENKLLDFLYATLHDDLLELMMRLTHVRTKEHFRYLNFASSNLEFCLNRPSNIWGARTQENYHKVENADDLFETELWYEQSPLMKDLFYPNESGNAQVVFQKENNKAISGLKDIRLLVEPLIDDDCLDNMLDILGKITSFDMTQKKSKEALLMACQMFGEYSHHLSDTFKANIPNINDFPFESIYGIRSNIKIAVTRKNRFAHLLTTLQDTQITNQTYIDIQQELLSLRPILEQFKRANNTFIKSAIDVKPHSKLKVSNPTHFQSHLIDTDNLDDDANEILSLFNDLCQGYVHPSVAHTRDVLLKLFCNDFPCIEIKREQQNFLNKIKSTINAMCQFHFSNNKLDNLQKGDISKKNKRISRLLTKKMVNSIKIPAKVKDGPPRTKLINIDNFSIQLTTIPTQTKPTELDYLKDQLDLIITSIQRISELVSNLNELNPVKLRQLIDDNNDISYAIKFYVTIIGQSVSALKKDDAILAYADDELFQELLSLRWVRNNEMHNMNQPIGESFLRWYNPRIRLGDHNLKSSEISSYLHSIKKRLTFLKGRINGNKKVDHTSYVLLSLTDNLRNAVERSGIQFIMCVPDENWLYRDIVKMTWRLLLNTQAVQSNYVVVLNTKLGVSGTKDEIGNKRLLKCYLQSAAHYLLEMGSDCSPWVSLYDLDEHCEKIIALAKQNNLNLNGVDGYPLTRKNTDTLFIIAVTPLIDKLAMHDQDKIFATFHKQVCGLLGNSVKINTDINYAPSFQLQRVVNSIRLFRLVESGLPFSEVLNHLKNCGVNIDINFYVRGYTTLHILSQSYCADELYFATEHLINNLGANPNLLDKHGNTVLHSSARDNDAKYCEKLMQCKNVDPNQLNNKGKLAVQLAADRNSTDAIDVLLKRTTLSPQQQLIIAIETKNSLMVKQLIETDNIDVNAADQFGNFPVFLAANNGDLETLTVLKDNGANLTIVDEGCSVLHINCSSNYPNTRLISFLIKENIINVNATNTEGDTPLHCAAACDYVDLVRVLLELGADPKISNANNQTALHRVSQGGHMSDSAITIASQLIDAGVPLDQKDNDLGTVLHIAALENHQRLAEMILNKSPQIMDIPCSSWLYDNAKPIDIARMENHDSLVTAFINAQNKNAIETAAKTAIKDIFAEINKELTNTCSPIRTSRLTSIAVKDDQKNKQRVYKSVQKIHTLCTEAINPQNSLTFEQACQKIHVIIHNKELRLDNSRWDRLVLWMREFLGKLGLGISPKQRVQLNDHFRTVHNFIPQEQHTQLSR